MKRQNKEHARNACVVVALILAVIALVLTCITKIKYWEYSGWWVMLNHFSESLPSLIIAGVSAVLLMVSKLLDR